ncbi:MAG: hypothetical protein PHC50_06605 [Candidatus Cloacimonetes bacterium]|nr:hypothetical protein [Candidatus Cloacimonadota bacterium]
MPRNVWIILLMALLLLSACGKEPTKPKGEGELPIRMNLAPATQMGFDVTRVAVTISKGSYNSSMDLIITGDMAEGTFHYLEPGTYAIQVAVYSGTTLIATGSGTGEVMPAQTTTVQISLEFEPGSLEVIVVWGNPYVQSRRVLMLGNSYTYYNNGVNVHLQGLLRSAQPNWEVVVESRTGGGFTLADHYLDPLTMYDIQYGNWDLVILQEQSSRPVNDPELFYQYAGLLNTEIRNSGALTGFFMTWAYQNSPWMYEPLRDAYLYAGASLEAEVAPVGVAFNNASVMGGLPNLYDSDGSHPSLHGSYLAACTMLAKFWNINPMGNSYRPTGISANDAADLQQLAWTSLR